MDLDRSKSVGLVPTMGAFHEGHLSLMRAAKEACDLVVVSLFVNPLQFGKGEDLARYPRDEKRDAELAESVGVDVLFAPSVSEVYPRPSTVVSVPDVTLLWEGAARPGHFDGVSTVVCKLFNMVAPDVAFFGQKDLQQCAVIRRMVEDLNMWVSLEFRPTFRESDGLAMSSRNVYLNPHDRAVAPNIYRILKGLVTSSESTIIRGEKVGPDAIVDTAISELGGLGFVVDYLGFVNPLTFEPLETIETGGAFIVAARLGTTRLIDNIIIDI